MTAILTPPFRIARTVAEDTSTVPAAICRAGSWGRTVDSVPAMVTRARAIEARALIRAVEGAQTIRRDPLFIAIKPYPLRVADARLIDTGTMGRAIAFALICTPVNGAVWPGKSCIACARAIVRKMQLVKGKRACTMKRTIAQTVHILRIGNKGRGAVDA